MHSTRSTKKRPVPRPQVRWRLHCLGNAHARVSMAHPLSAGDFEQVGWGRGCRSVVGGGGQGAAGPGCALLECGLSGGHCSSKGKRDQPLEMLSQDSLRRGSTPRRFHSDLSYHTQTTVYRLMPAGGMILNARRRKVFKTEDRVKTARRGDFFVCPRSSAMHWSKGRWAVNYPTRHKKLRQCPCRLRKGIRSCYQTSHECM